MDSDVFSPSNVRLDAAFYQREDVVGIARDLLGRVLVTQFEGVRTSGLITEVEAYRAPDDRACHAWNNRRTPRTEVMFRPGGSAYIYLCYGIHHLFNVVTGPEGAAHAVLVRGIEPLEGIDLMLHRRKARRFESSLTTGPGALAQALGLHTRMSGQNMLDPGSPVWIERGAPVLSVGAGPRIGVDYAGECAAWPWRFWVEGSRFYRKK
ncbi:MAG: DNA-3-methyladenine glycosylase [Saprospiraceae bacterium]|nr:DNA-3-methyladenine glycosylase [Saprospiraceae bacterium]